MSSNTTTTTSEEAATFHVEEQHGGDARTLRTALKFMYEGCIVDQHTLMLHYFPQLVALADFLQIDGLTDACKLLLDEQLIREKKKVVVLSYFSFLIVIYNTYV